MLVSHSHKFVFIKTEKTASTSCEIFLRQFCSADTDIVTPIASADEAIARRLGVTEPKNYFIRSSRGKQKLAESIHRYTRLLPSRVLPAGISPARSIDLCAHSKALDLYRLLEPRCADLSRYFIFGFTRHPLKRFVSFLNYKKVVRSRQEPELLNRDIIRHARYIFEPTSHWFHDNQGTLLASKVYQFEHLEDSLAQACQTLGLVPRIPFSEVPKAKDSASLSEDSKLASVSIRKIVESQEIRQLIYHSHQWEMSQFYSA